MIHIGLGKINEAEKLRLDIKYVLSYVKYIGVAFGALFLVRLIDYRKLHKYSNVFYIIATVMARNVCDVWYSRC